MRAIVFRGVGDVRLEQAPEPEIEAPTDAIVRLTARAICGTDLHILRGTLPGMRPGTILGHEGVGVVEELGDDVRNFDIGDRVVICSTIACGSCPFCGVGNYSQCDRANPNGPMAGTAFFGGPVQSGAFDGLQAELARIPFANVGMVKLPEELSDDQAILLSDIFPTGYFGADLADIGPGKTVAIYGCGPVGQFAIASARLKDAGRILAVDCIDSRLEMARDQGAEVIDFAQEDPVESIMRLTRNVGVDCAIDAVGVDAARPSGNGKDQDGWHPGDTPSQAVTWAVQGLSKAGTLSIVGVYPLSAQSFPLGAAMNKNLNVRMGNCNHRKYIPLLMELVLSGQIDPTRILTELEPRGPALEAYRAFEEGQPEWKKVELQPGE